MYLVNIVQLDNYHYRRFNAPGSILRFPRYLRPPRQILRPIHPAQHHPPNQRIEPTGMGSTDLLVLGPHGREWQREGGSVCESFCRRSGGSCLWEIQAACIRTKQRDLALAHWQQEWPTGVHGRTAHKIMPAPTKDIFAVHERLRRCERGVDSNANWPDCSTRLCSHNTAVARRAAGFQSTTPTADLLMRARM